MVPRAGFLALPSWHSETSGIKLVPGDHNSFAVLARAWALFVGSPVKVVGDPLAVDPLFQGLSHTHTDQKKRMNERPNE